MKRMRVVLLMPEQTGKVVISLAQSVGLHFDPVIVNNPESLQAACGKPIDLLLSFQTGVIVPKHILHMPSLLAANVHAASPDFPGRDPHHFAVYRGAKKYGATLHYMTESVDQGPIIDVELFEVPADIFPAELLEKANNAGMKLIERLFEDLAVSIVPPPRNELQWGGNKTKRSDFLELCRISCEMPESEFLNRLRSTAMPEYNNLYLDIHGYRFRIEGKAK